VKTVNTNYGSFEQLSAFVAAEGIIDNKQLLIQVFTGKVEASDITRLQQALQKLFTEAIVIGATSDGNIIDGNVPYLGQTTLSFTQFEKTQLASVLIAAKPTDYETGLAVAKSLIRKDTKAIISFTDGINTNGDEFLRGLHSANPEVVLSGGMAGDNGNIQQTTVFNLTEQLQHGAIGVGLSHPDLIVNTHYNFDWQAVGRKMEVTRSNGNVIYDIDHQPARQIYEKYLGKEITNRLPATGIEFPLMMIDKGTRVGRAVIGVLDDGALVFAGNVKQGSRVQFGIGSKEHIIQDAYEALSKFKHFSIESTFIYSCMARRRFLGAQAGCEIEPFKSAAPVAGFYTYGEFYYSQITQSVSLLNQSMTVLTLSESEHSHINLCESTNRSCRALTGGQSDTLVAISNLAITVSNDLEVLNTVLEHEVEKKSQELMTRTLVDSITGLPNRSTLLRNLRISTKETLIVININNFSKINGFYGLDAGDELLLKLSLKLKKALENPANDLSMVRLFKLPSDEYAILTSTVGEQFVRNSIKAINKEVFETPFRILGFNILVQATWVFSDTDGSEKGLIQAGLSSKEARNKKQNYIKFDVYKFNENQHQIELAHKVRRGILENRLYPVFQPIYDNQTGELEKFECLARLKDEQGHVISPLIFIEVAQMIQMYSILTEIMVHKSFKTFQGTGLNFSVNLSLEDILSQETQAMLFEAIHLYQVGPQLTIEILENQALEDESEIFKFISSIKALGAKIAIDDFGSGFANYQHLAKLQADFIKIDGSLIKKLGKDSIANSVVDSMVLFAQKQNIKVVAEFVCDSSVYQQVKAKNIDYSQGFYLSEPLDKLPEIVKKQP